MSIKVKTIRDEFFEQSLDREAPYRVTSQVYDTRVWCMFVCVLPDIHDIWQGDGEAPRVRVHRVRARARHALWVAPHYPATPLPHYPPTPLTPPVPRLPAEWTSSRTIYSYSFNDLKEILVDSFAFIDVLEQSIIFLSRAFKRFSVWVPHSCPYSLAF